MKTRKLFFHITPVLTAVCLSSVTYAATATKSATGTDLTGVTAGVWAGGSGANGSPTIADIATWTSSSLGAALTVDSDVAWGSINISGALTDIDITGIGSITTGSITLTGTQILSIANNIILNGSATYNIADATASTADDATLSGVISGAFALTKTGAGTVAVTGSNSYTGVTTITTGVLSVNSLANGGSNSAIGTSSNAAGNLVFNGGTLKYTGGTMSTDRAFKVTANSGIEVSNDTSTLTFNSAVASDGTYTRGLTKTGAGTLVLGGASNNAWLQLWVNAGTVELAKSTGAVGNAVAGINAIADGATVKLTGASGDQIFGGDLASFGVNGLAGTLDLSGHSEGTSHFNSGSSTTGKITNSVASTIATWTVGESNVTSSFAGIIEDGSGIVALTKVGTGTQTLSGTNTYTGITSLNGGTLTVGSLANGGSNSGIGASSSAAANLVFNGGTLKYTGAPVSTDRAFTLNANSGIEVTESPSTLTFNSSANGTYTTTLTKTGAGTLVLGGAAHNNYVHLSVNTGTVELAKSVGGIQAVAEVRSIAAGATVKLTGASGDQIFGGSNLAAFGVNGLAGTLDLNGHSESTSNFNGVSTGKITNSTAATTATWTMGQSDANSSFAGVIENGTGTIAVTKTGTGTQTLSGTHTYTGATTLNAGVLSVALLANGGSNSGIGASTNAAGNLVLNGGTLKYTGTSATTDRSLTLSANSGIEVTESTSILTFNSSAQGTYTKILTKSGAGTLVLGGTSNNPYVELSVSAGTVELAKSIGGVNAVAGINAIAAAATVKLTGTGGDQIFGGTNLATFGVNGLAGTLDLSGHSESTSHFNGASTGKITNSTAATTAIWTVGESNVTSHFAGVIEDGAGTVALAKIGSGTQTLSGANTYSGATTVNGGTLLVNNTADSGTGSGIVTVKTNATLGGTGSITGAVTLEAGATIAPGTSIESLATGTLTLPAGATLKAEFNSSGSPTADVVNVTGDVILGGDLVLTDLATVPAAITPGTKLTLMTYSGTLSGSFNGIADDSTFSLGANLFKIRYADSKAVTLESMSTGSGYSTWSDSNAPSQSADQDYDNDGVPNGIEYVLGGLATSNDSDKLPALTTANGNLTFSFLRDQASKTADTEVTIEVGTDLSTWPIAYVVGNSSGGGVIVTDNLDGSDTITLTIPQAPDAKKFARLQVTITP